MSACADLGISEFPNAALLHLTAELRRHGLHSVADAEHRYAKFEDGVRRTWLGAFDDRCVTAREDDPARLELADERIVHIERMQLAVDVRLAHPSCDELRVLRAEIENQDFLVLHRYSTR